MTNNLLRHPRVYAKLKEEIRCAFKSEDEIKLSEANNLPYLNACIEENLRIFPPAPIGFLRAIQRGGDLIDGHHVPEGVSNMKRLRRMPLKAEFLLRLLYLSAHGVRTTIRQTSKTQIGSFLKDGWMRMITRTMSDLLAVHSRLAPGVVLGKSMSNSKIATKLKLTSFK